MNIVKRTLKAVWDSLQQPHDPLNPSPEKRKELEKEGYRFTFNVESYGRMLVKTYRITAPDGQKVACFGASEAATLRYLAVYRGETPNTAAIPGRLRHRVDM